MDASFLDLTLSKKTNYRYKILKEVGSGANGRAYICTHALSNRKMVLKRIDLALMDEQEKQSALNEARVLKMVCHPNIIGYRDYFVTPKQQLCIVMDYAEGGDLSTEIRRRKEGGKLRYYKEEEIMDWFSQLALALKHVHDHKILHRDLKGQNIFLSKDKKILKLGDFGIAKVLDSTTAYAQTAIGTPMCMSPELCDDKPYNMKSDIWALGCVLYEITSLRHPFESKTLPALIMKIISKDPPDIPSHYSSDLNDIIRSMLEKEPNKRPSIDDLLGLPFVQKATLRVLLENHNQISFKYSNGSYNSAPPLVDEKPSLNLSQPLDTFSSSFEDSSSSGNSTKSADFPTVRVSLQQISPSNRLFQKTSNIERLETISRTSSDFSGSDSSFQLDQNNNLSYNDTFIQSPHGEQNTNSDNNGESDDRNSFADIEDELNQNLSYNDTFIQSPHPNVSPVQKHSNHHDREIAESFEIHHVSLDEFNAHVNRQNAEQSLNGSSSSSSSFRNQFNQSNDSIASDKIITLNLPVTIRGSIRSPNNLPNSPTNRYSAPSALPTYVSNRSEKPLEQNSSTRPRSTNYPKRLKNTWFQNAEEGLNDLKERLSDESLQGTVVKLERQEKLRQLFHDRRKESKGPISRFSDWRRDSLPLEQTFRTRRKQFYQEKKRKQKEESQALKKKKKSHLKRLKNAKPRIKIEKRISTESDIKEDQEENNPNIIVVQPPINTSKTHFSKMQRKFNTPITTPEPMDSQPFKNVSPQLYRERHRKPMKRNISTKTTNKRSSKGQIPEKSLKLRDFIRENRRKKKTKEKDLEVQLVLHPPRDDSVQIVHSKIPPPFPSEENDAQS